MAFNAGWAISPEKLKGAQVAITEASVREASADVAELTVEGLHAIEIRPVGLGNPGDAATAGKAMELHKPVSRGNPDYYFMEAFVLRSQGRLKEADSVLDKGLLHHPTNFRLLLNRGYVRYKLGKFALALKDFLTALEGLQEHVTALTGKAPVTVNDPSPHDPLSFTYDHLNEREALSMVTARMSARASVPGSSSAPSPRRPATASMVPRNLHPADVARHAPIRIRIRDAAAVDAAKSAPTLSARQWIAKAGKASMGTDADTSAAALTHARMAQIVTRYDAALASMVSFACNLRFPHPPSGLLSIHNEFMQNLVSTQALLAPSPHRGDQPTQLETGMDIPAKFRDPVQHLTEALALLLPSESNKRAALLHARAVAHRVVGQFLGAVQDYAESRRQCVLSYDERCPRELRIPLMSDLCNVLKTHGPFDPTRVPADMLITSVCHVPLAYRQVGTVDANAWNSVVPADLPPEFACAAGYIDCFYGDGQIYRPEEFRPSETALSAATLREKCKELLPCEASPSRVPVGSSAGKRRMSRVEAMQAAKAAMDVAALLDKDEVARLANYSDLLLMQSAAGRSELINRDPVAFIMHITRGSRLLSSLPSYAHAAMAKVMAFREFEAGDIIYRQGDAADFYYVIVEGSVNIHLDRQAPAVRMEFRMASALKLGRRWLKAARERIAKRHAATATLASETSEFSLEGSNHSPTESIPALTPARPPVRSVDTNTSSASRRLSARLLKADDVRQVRMSLDLSRLGVVPGLLSDVPESPPLSPDGKKQYLPPSPPGKVPGLRLTWTQQDAALLNSVVVLKAPPIKQVPKGAGWTGEGKKLGPSGQKPLAATSELRSHAHSAEQMLPTPASGKAPTSAAEAEMTLGLMLGTLHVGEAFGERAMHTAWALELEHQRMLVMKSRLGSTVHLFQAGQKKRTKEQAGLWREVTAVAAERTTVLCLHKDKYIAVMNHLHDHMDTEIASFLARVPLMQCCTHEELRMLAKHALQRRFVSGSTVVVQGQPWEGLYILRAGRCRIETQQLVTTTKQVVIPFDKVQRAASAERTSGVVPPLRLPGAAGVPIPVLKLGEKRVMVTSRRPSIMDKEGNRQYLSSFGVDVSRNFYVASRYKKPTIIHGDSVPAEDRGVGLREFSPLRTLEDEEYLHTANTARAAPSVIANEMIKRRRRLSVTTDNMLRRASLAGAIDLDFKPTPTVEVISPKPVPTRPATADGHAPRYKTIVMTKKRNLQLGALGLYEHFGEAQVLSVPQEFTEEPPPKAHADAQKTLSAYYPRVTSPRKLRSSVASRRPSVRSVSFEYPEEVEPSTNEEDSDEEKADDINRFPNRPPLDVGSPGAQYRYPRASIASRESMKLKKRARGAVVKLSSPATVTCDSHVEMIIITRDALFSCTSFATRQAMREYLIRSSTRAAAAEAALTEAHDERELHDRERAMGMKPDLDLAPHKRMERSKPGAVANSTGVVTASEKLHWDKFRHHLVGRLLFTSANMAKATHQARGAVIAFRGRKYKIPTSTTAGTIEEVRRAKQSSL